MTTDSVARELARRALDMGKPRGLVYVCSPLRADVEGWRCLAMAYGTALAELGFAALVPHVFSFYLYGERDDVGRKVALACMGLCSDLHVLYDVQTGVTEGMRAEIGAFKGRIVIVEIIEWHDATAAEGQAGSLAKG